MELETTVIRRAPHSFVRRAQSEYAYQEYTWAMSEGAKDLMSEVKSFCARLDHVFSWKKRDPQTQRLLEEAKSLLQNLSTAYQKLSSGPGTPRQSRGAGMGQMWVKLDELKRENDDLKRLLSKNQDERLPHIANKPQGPGEVIISELHKVKSENEGLREELEKAHREIKELTMVNANLQDEYKRNKVALETIQDSQEQFRREKKTLETNLSNAQTEVDSLKKKLASAPDSKPPPIPAKPAIKPAVKPKFVPDKRAFENINEKCRPSVIAMRYNALESEEWIDAKEALEDNFDKNEDEIVKFLSDLLMNTYSSCKDVYNNMIVSFLERLKQPTVLQKVTEYENCSSVDKPLPDDLKEAIHSVLKQNWENLDTKPVTEMAISKTSEDHRDLVESALLENKALGRYLHESARLTWQMVIQQPAMALSTSDVTYDEERHKLWWSCDQSGSGQIDYFVWPSLYDCENGNLLVKGCVYTKP